MQQQQNCVDHEPTIILQENDPKPNVNSNNNNNNNNND